MYLYFIFRAKIQNAMSLVGIMIYMIRRYRNAFDSDGSDQNYGLRSIRLQYDYDTTMAKNWRSFLLASNRVEWEQVHAIHRSWITIVIKAYRAHLLPVRRKQKMNVIFCRSCIIVVLQSNRTLIVISITSVVVECIMVSSYRSRIAIVMYSVCVAVVVNVIVFVVKIESKMQYQSKTMSESLCGHGPVGQTLSSRQMQNVRSLLKNEWVDNVITYYVCVYMEARSSLICIHRK